MLFSKYSDIHGRIALMAVLFMLTLHLELSRWSHLQFYFFIDKPLSVCFFITTGVFTLPQKSNTKFTATYFPNFPIMHRDLSQGGVSL